MKKLLFIFFLLSFVCVNAQSIYEIKFTGNKDAKKYTCLLIYYNENDAYMRINYFNAANNYRVVEVRYTGKSGKYPDGRPYFSLTGGTAVFIADKTEGETYNPDYFVWINNESLPYTTDALPDVNGNRTVYQVESYLKLDVKSLTKTYLHSFYNEWDADYIAFSKMTSDYAIKDTRTKNAGTTLHLIVLANTAIFDIGPGCAVDLMHLDNEFSAIASTLNISYDPHLLSGNYFTKENLQTTLNDLVVGSNDIVIFVYRGHGFRWSNQSSSYPSLALTRSHSIPVSNDNTILLESIYSSIVAKGGRLNVVLGDCCNSDIGIPQMTRDNYLYQQSNASAEYDKLNSLFLERQGNLLFAASKEGEVSWTNATYGGFFTSSFLQALDEEISYLRSSESSWVNIVNNTQTYSLYKSSNCTNCTFQHPIAYNKITKR